MSDPLPTNPQSAPLQTSCGTWSLELRFLCSARAGDIHPLLHTVESIRIGAAIARHALKLERVRVSVLRRRVLRAVRWGAACRGV